MAKSSPGEPRNFLTLNVPNLIFILSLFQNDPFVCVYFPRKHIISSLIHGLLFSDYVVLW